MTNPDPAAVEATRKRMVEGGIFSEDEADMFAPIEVILKKNGVTCKYGSLGLMCDINNYYVTHYVEKSAVASLVEASNGILKYFRSGNSIPVERATIKIDSKEVKKLIEALANWNKR